MVEEVVQDVARGDEVNVLITGFGPFMSIATNPSWLAVRPLHNLRLPLSSVGMQGGEGVVRIQVLEMAVHYGAVLDLIPRLHGQTPRGEVDQVWYDARLGAFGGRADATYPRGYPLEVPGGGWDVVVHVGVGRGGTIRCETQAHKTGYGKPDTNGSFAPLVEPPPRHAVLARYLDPNGQVRGFDSRYDDFDEIEQTTINVARLIKAMAERGWAGVVEQSFDPGRYLCDFSFYASLCHAKLCPGRPDVLFVHVPPQDDGPGVQKCTQAITDIACYLAKQRVEASQPPV